ncbi:hypothetical protein D3C77_608850 [compost metagenome]
MAPAKTIGKQAMKTVNTGVASPMPNQSMASTSQAMGGMPSSKVTSGRESMAAVSERPASSPSALPASRAAPRPYSVRRVETASCGRARPLSNISIRRSRVACGPGSTKGP